MRGRDSAPVGAPSAREPNSPRVIASFSDYEPPFDPVPMVRRMLDSVPEKYLMGLNAVVLSNASGLSGKRRRAKVKSRKQKAGLRVALGLYHPAFRGNPAWIEMFVDNIMRGWDSWWCRVRYIREMRISDVLFHEIGHHIHYTVRPEHREKEDVADVWKVRLQRNYSRERYRWIGVIARIVGPVARAPLEHIWRYTELRALKGGQISRAEYLEETQGKFKLKP